MTGKMVVARPRMPERRIARANRKVLARRLQFDATRMIPSIMWATPVDANR
jgi:hypothetical protein